MIREGTGLNWQCPESLLTMISSHSGDREPQIFMIYDNDLALLHIGLLTVVILLDSATEDRLEAGSNVLLLMDQSAEEMATRAVVLGQVEAESNLHPCLCAAHRPNPLIPSTGHSKWGRKLTLLQSKGRGMLISRNKELQADF